MTRKQIAAVVLAAAMSAAPAAALPVPVPPTNEEVAQEWVNPSIRPSEGQEGLTVTLIDAPADGPLTAQVSNGTDQEIDGLTVTPRRGPASGSVDDALVASVADPGEYDVAGETVEVPALKPGEEREVTVEFRPAEQPRSATYPHMLVLAHDGAQVDTERWHSAAAGTGEEPEDQVAPGLSLLYPLSAQIDSVPGETGEAPDRAPLIMASEQLAGQLASGGRLDKLVDTYLEAEPAVRESSCIAVDPALLDTVTRMTRGYSVNKTRPSPAQQRQRLRDSWGSNAGDSGAQPGQGADEAKEWLDKLTSAARDNCVVALPWGNADLNAVAQTGDQWLAREAVERGPQIVEEVLGAQALPNVVIPGNGYLSEDAAQIAGWADAPGYSLEDAWEKTQRSSHRAPGGRVAGGQQSTLDKPKLGGVAAAPEPEEPVRVLAADNSAPAQLPGIETVPYDSALAATLAATGPRPETAAYLSPNLRYDFTVDSAYSRDLTAAAAVKTAAYSNSGSEDAGTVLVAPPATWQADTAAHIVGAAAELIRDREAEPLPLPEYLGVADREVFSAANYPDPAEYSDTEILNVGQQARFINDITGVFTNDSAIALTRYGFTQPLRTNLLEAIPVSGRRALQGYVNAEQRTRTRLAAERDTLSELRSAVALIPPGNVYTRASESSPLLIVAENGLPLPVDASILYDGPDNAVLNTPREFRIPARGSITIQMTADLPAEAERTDLQLYLSTPQGQPISQPVGISVQTAGGALSTWIILAGLAGLFALAVLFQLGKRRGSGRRRRDG